MFYTFGLTFDQYTMASAPVRRSQRLLEKQTFCCVCLEPRSLTTILLLWKTHPQELLYYRFTSILSLSTLSRRHMAGKTAIRTEKLKPLATNILFLPRCAPLLIGKLGTYSKRSLDDDSQCEYTKKMRRILHLM